MPKRVLHDEFFNKAKAEGYLSRAAYKLIQINESRKLIRPGQRILDLGCAPGAWLQVAGKLVTTDGRVVGIDLKPCQHSFPAHITHTVGDIYDTDPATLTALAGGLFDVVLSDMAPNTTGHADAERSAALCQQVLAMLPALLKPGGHLAMKILEGTGYTDTLDMTKDLFTDTKGFKPKASRAVSREMFIVAKVYSPSA